MPVAPRTARAQVPLENLCGDVDVEIGIPNRLDACEDPRAAGELAGLHPLQLQRNDFLIKPDPEKLSDTFRPVPTKETRQQSPDTGRSQPRA